MKKFIEWLNEGVGLSTHRGADIQWDHSTDKITKISDPSFVIEDFNDVIWMNATSKEKERRWNGLVDYWRDVHLTDDELSEPDNLT